ncbi:MAG: hypothetical protein RLZZ444_19 [Pseudomonadota bacterium]
MPGTDRRMIKRRYFIVSREGFRASAQNFTKQLHVRSPQFVAKILMQATCQHQALPLMVGRRMFLSMRAAIRPTLMTIAMVTKTDWNALP